MLRLQSQKFKRLLALCLTLVLLLCSVPVYSVTAQEAESLSVSFDSDYAAAGEKLSAVVTGDSAGISYLWQVDGFTVSTESFYTPRQEDLEKFITVTVKSGGDTAAAKMYFSRLPVIYIDTENGETIQKDDYIDADMHIQGNDEYPTSDGYTGLTEIKGRGHSTWAQDKKPYKLKLDKKTNLFGMGKNKHWVLLANALDPSHMRNAIASDVADALDVLYMDGLYVNLVLNGKFVGNYQLVEHIRVDSKRVDIWNWEDAAEEAGGVAEDLSGLTTEKGYDLTGGYLLELDARFSEISQFKTRMNMAVTVNKPEYAATNDEMMAYLQTYIQAYEDAVISKDFYNANGEHYSDLFDFDDLVNYWLVNEFMNNIDSGSFGSTFMYKDIGGDVFHMGPVWDFDYSSGNYLHTTFEGYSAPPDHWKYVPGTWFRNLVRDPYFVARLQERYWEKHDELESVINKMDTYASYIVDSVNADHVVWGVPTSFDFEYNHLRTWFQERIDWIDQQFATLETGLDSLEEYSSSGTMQLALQAADDGALGADMAEVIPADAVLLRDSELKVNVSVNNSAIKSVAFYLNGKHVGETVPVQNGSASITLTADQLVAGENRNVIQVHGLNSSNKYVDTTYITVKKDFSDKLLPSENLGEIISAKLQDIPYGASLDELSQDLFPATVAYDRNGETVSVSGTFSWQNGLTIPPIGNSNYRLTFTPDTAYADEYATVSVSVFISVQASDISALQALVDSCEGLSETQYTVQSWENFATALARAKELLAMELPGQNDIDVAVAALQKAKDGLTDTTFYAVLPENIYKGEMFTLELHTDFQASRVILRNENGGSIGITILEKIQNPDGTFTWKIALMIGSAGQGRLLSVYAKNGAEEIKIGSFSFDVQNPPPIYFDVQLPASIIVNKPFEMTLITNSYITALEILRENGTTIPLTIISKQENANDSTTWKLQITPTESGIQTFTIEGKKNGNNQMLGTFSCEVRPFEEGHVFDVTIPPVIVKNEKFTLTVLTSDNVKKLYFLNEIGRPVSAWSTQRMENEDGTCTWTVELSIGTANPDRSLTIYSKDGTLLTELGSFSFSVLEQRPEEDPVRVILPEKITQSLLFPITIITPNGISKLTFKNENGGTVTAMALTKKTNEDGSLTWTANMSFGSAGNNREITIYDSSDSSNLKELTKFQFDVAVYEPVVQLPTQEIIAGEPFEVSIDTTISINGISLKYADGAYLETSLLSKRQNADGSLNWKLSTTAYTAGNNIEICIYTGTKQLGSFTVNIKNSEVPDVFQASAPKSVTQYDSFQVTITTNKIDNLILQTAQGANVYYTTVSKKVNADDTLTWTLSLMFGSASKNRRTDVYTGTTGNLRLLGSFTLDVLERPAEIIFPSTIYKGVAFDATIITSPDVTILVLMNENGGKLGYSVQSKTIGENGLLIWNLRLSIGSAGQNRTITVCNNTKPIGSITFDVI